MEKMEEEVKEMAVDDGLLKGSAVGTCAMAMEVGCSRSIETNGKRSDMFGEDDEAFDALLVQSVRETELSLAKEESVKISSSLNSLHPAHTGGAGDLPLMTTTVVACTEAITTTTDAATVTAAAAAAATATATAAAASVVVSPGRKQIGLNHDNADHDNGADDDHDNGAVVAITGDDRTLLPSMVIIAESADLISPAILPPAIVSPGRKKPVAGAKSGNAAAASLGEETIVEVSKSLRVTAQGTGQATGLNQSSSTKRARRIGK